MGRSSESRVGVAGHRSILCPGRSDLSDMHVLRGAVCRAIDWVLNMAQHLVFLVHGMGSQPAEWAEDTVALLGDLYKRYARLKQIPFTERFEFVPIHYAGEFEAIVNDWENQGTAILGQGALGDPVHARSFVSWLDNAGNTEDNFLWSHLSDVALYRFFSLVRERVKVVVARQLHAALEATRPRDWSVIAHSLGTAVMHDTLHAMAVSVAPGASVALLPAGAPQAQAVAMVANVSKILENDIDVYRDTAVAPAEKLGQRGRVCLNYLSFNNRLDVFTLPKPFDPHDVPLWELARVEGRFIDVSSIRHVHELNVHALNHYLVHPSVHIPLFRTLAGPGTVTRREALTAQEDFVRYPSKQLKEHLEEKLEGDGVGGVFDVLGRFFKES